MPVDSLINTVNIPPYSKIKALVILTKFRLSALVVFSAAICYLIGSQNPSFGQLTTQPIDWTKFTWLIIGGFLVTAASNGINQVIEQDLDKLMVRTAQRPLPLNILNTYEALLFCFSIGSLGIMILYFLMNPLSGILGGIALLSYTLIYTPLKRITPFAVFVGAFPGAIPPLLGYVAATNKIDINALLLFGIQFIWQFPHFWAIAWIMDDDYRRAGFKMLPTVNKDKSAAFQILVYSFSLIPISILPYVFGSTSWLAAIIIGASSIWFSFYALMLYKECTDSAARKLMFASFIYLPVVQLAWLADKMIM